MKDYINYIILSVFVLLFCYLRYEFQTQDSIYKNRILSKINQNNFIKKWSQVQNKRINHLRNQCKTLKLDEHNTGLKVKNDYIKQKIYLYFYLYVYCYSEQQQIVGKISFHSSFKSFLLSSSKNGLISINFSVIISECLIFGVLQIE